MKVMFNAGTSLVDSEGRITRPFRLFLMGFTQQLPSPGVAVVSSDGSPTSFFFSILRSIAPTVPAPDADAQWFDENGVASRPVRQFLEAAAAA